MVRLRQAGLRLALATCWMGAALLAGCGGGGDYASLRGNTMGTYYSVQYQASDACAMQQATIDALLAGINATMSTYRPDSELTQLNGSNDTQWQPVSAQLLLVLRTAQQVWEQSEGAFDVTVGPIVNLWGFGPDDTSERPTPEQERNAQARVGMDKLQLGADKIRKRQADIYIDLSALAKGYAVDAVASLLDEADCSSYLVDIGGEVKARGVNARRTAWRIGIEVPDPAKYGVIQRVVELDDVSVATSGDYRNYRMIADVRVDHVIDARTGAPADNAVASATVIHPSAMLADAYATVMMVLGEEAAIAFANDHAIAVLLIVNEAGTEFREVYNDSMQPYLLDF